MTMEGYVSRAVAGEPLAYILEEWDFYGLTLQVTPDVLIPRDDTCALVDLALKAGLDLPYEARILDLCTGSGCIGIALATHLKDTKVTLADLSRAALAVAKGNVSAHNLSGRMACVCADALGDPPAFLGTFDMIVSNPPYITARQMLELEPSVRDYEPALALDGGDDGLNFYRAIAKNYGSVLKPGGYLAFEFGMGQADQVCAILEAEQFSVLEIKEDFQQIRRAVLARKDNREDGKYGNEEIQL